MIHWLLLGGLAALMLGGKKRKSNTRTSDDEIVIFEGYPKGLDLEHIPAPESRSVTANQECTRIGVADQWWPEVATPRIKTMLKGSDGSEDEILRISQEVINRELPQCPVTPAVEEFADDVIELVTVWANKPQA